MPKILKEPMVIVAEQKADRLDIIGYEVDAQAKTVKVTFAPSRLTDAGDRVVMPSFTRTIGADDTIAAMAEITTNIVTAVLQGLMVPADQVAQLRAAMLARPDQVWPVYYGCTRDGLYAKTT